MTKRITKAMLALLAITFLSSNASAEDLPFKVGYKIGKGLKVETKDGNFEWNLVTKLQLRFTYNALETAADNNTFAVQRGEIGMSGHVYKDSLKYGFEMNINTAGNGGTPGSVTLNDYFIDWTPYDYFGIKVGQYKVPFLMQQLTSTGKQQFVDRALATGFFDLTRDIGLDLHGTFMEKKLGYDLFIMNGDGQNIVNTNQGLMAGTRLNYAIMGTYEPTESDVDYSQTPNLGVGIAYAFLDSANSGNRRSQSGTIPVGTKASFGTIDIGLKYKGFSFQTAGMITRTHEGANLTNWGYNVQAGYFVIPQHLEIALKGDGAIFTNATRNQYEYALGLNYFIRGHPIKLSTDLSYIMNNRAINLDDYRVRTQLQVMF